MRWLQENAHWIFDGIGTAVLGFVLGWAAKTYQVKRYDVRQTQTTQDRSSAIQSGRDTKIKK
jgi:hypothetical protein